MGVDEGFRARRGDDERAVRTIVEDLGVRTDGALRRLAVVRRSVS